VASLTDEFPNVSSATARLRAVSCGYSEPSQTPNALLILLEAPVALIQWIAIKKHTQTDTGLNFSMLLVMAFCWSVILGWASAVLIKKCVVRKL
jgi:hypothetical protein